jgi:hypothetical protein
MATKHRRRTAREAPRPQAVERVVAEVYRAFREGTLAGVDLPIDTIPSDSDEEFAADVARVLAASG